MDRQRMIESQTQEQQSEVTISHPPPPPEFKKARIATSSSSSSSTNVGTRSIPLNAWVDRMSTADIKQAQRLFARAINLTMRPFEMFEDELWREFFTFIHPAKRVLYLLKISARRVLNV